MGKRIEIKIKATKKIKKSLERTSTLLVPVMDPNQRVLSILKKKRFGFRARNHSAFFEL